MFSRLDDFPALVIAPWCQAPWQRQELALCVAPSALTMTMLAANAFNADVANKNVMLLWAQISVA